MSLRLERFHAFARAQLPSPPARLLEIGCGDGALADVLGVDGYEVVGIDPNAPEGAMFRRVSFEDFEEEGGFDAVVASLSLHHLEDVEAGADKVASLLRTGGRLVVQEWAKENFTGDTARWYHAQRLKRATEEKPVPGDFEEWACDSDAHLAHVHPASEVFRALEERFATRVLEWVPYLYSHHLVDEVEPEERALIETGAIAATGVLYAGELRDA